ncbi:MAG TPA: SRPBCC family protein [Ardenticatenaceae bacterium]|nr:SRPBCC family protein [Ardenticatenaceae bacterium]
MAHAENVVEMNAAPADIFALAVDTPRWPEFLPHYRWVTELERGERCRTVEMAAHRDGIPVKWTSVQEWFPDEHRITFFHIAGITRGMDVVWHIEQQAEGVTRVSIVHDFDLRWPLIAPLANWVTGELFVRNIANKTLSRIKEIVEAGA